MLGVDPLCILLLPGKTMLFQLVTRCWSYLHHTSTCLVKKYHDRRFPIKNRFAILYYIILFFIVTLDTRIQLFHSVT